VFDYNFHWRPVFRDLPDLIAAGLVTIQVAALAMILGVIIGLSLALIRMHGRGPLRWFATTWVELARNTPALIQLFFFGFGLGAFGIFLSPFMIVLMGLTFNCAGYLAENFRGGFQAIPETQLRAARSLGHDCLAGLHKDHHSAGPAYRVPPDHQPDGVGCADVVARHAGRFSRAVGRDPVFRIANLPYL
jgi:His/Glu/Gln/Arg/opine family amino acid ABC transporter permease subunit